MDAEKFREKYRIAPTRLREWNYGSVGWYFVTFCVKDRKCVLSEITKNGLVRLTDFGRILREEICNTQVIRPNIGIDAFVIMPDHVHVIVEIMFETPHRGVSTHTLQQNSLGAIINQIKSIATKRIRIHDPEFSWQSRFYDRILRDESDLRNVRQYIENNPMEWITHPEHRNDFNIEP